MDLHTQSLVCATLCRQTWLSSRDDLAIGLAALALIVAETAACSLRTESQTWHTTAWDLRDELADRLGVHTGQQSGGKDAVRELHVDG